MPDVVTIDCMGRSTREINRAIRSAAAEGTAEVVLTNPAGRHNLGVALAEGIRLTIEGSAGYYVGGLNDGSRIRVRGGVGWGAAESMRDGEIEINGDAGNAVAASIRAGTVVVRGDASTRAGIAMKGGTLIVAGSVGPMAGFMMQKGRLIVVGDAAEGVADSMYAGTVYVGGAIGELGSDAEVREPEPAELDEIGCVLEAWKIKPAPNFRKIVAGGKLWNFRRSELAAWKAAF